MKQLIQIQSELKAPKNQFNSFGKYKYRSCEDILEAVKPLLLKHDCALVISDEIKGCNGLTYVEATAVLSCNGEFAKATAQAGIDPNRKGMDISQSFGSSSSYARKYALNGLFLIDDTKDADAANDHSDKKPKEEFNNVKQPTQEEKDILMKLVANIPQEDRGKAAASINGIKDYETYAKIQHRLEELQIPIDQIVNPSQADITKHLKKAL
jgi:hypothetical protein